MYRFFSRYGVVLKCRDAAPIVGKVIPSTTIGRTTVLRGAFKDDPGTKKEFFDNIKLQQEFAPR